jgi:hypothetical protein
VGNNFGGGVFEFGAPPGGGGAQMQLETSFVTPRSTDQSTFRSIAARGERVRADLLVRDPYEFLNLALVAVRRGDFEFDGELEKALFISADRHTGRDAGFPHRRLAFSRNPQKARSRNRRRSRLRTTAPGLSPRRPARPTPQGTPDAGPANWPMIGRFRCGRRLRSR